MLRSTSVGSLTRRVGCCFALLTAGCCVTFGAVPPAAEQALLQGRVDDAIGLLQPVLTGEPNNAAAHLLLCRAYLSEEATDQALIECQSAAANAPDSSAAHDWLGRALGQKAEHAGPFAGYSLAKRVRDAFEAAVRLDPHSTEAFDDLGEYYTDAPGIVGGGLDRAKALAAQGASVLPERARVLRASIAEKEKDFGTAEREFRTAAQESNRPDGWIDLGRYYARRHQVSEAVAAIKHGMELDVAHDSALAHGAEALIRLKVELQVAAAALRAYLSGAALSDSAPAFKVHTDLGKLLAARGDKAGARAEFQKALSLASAYPAARKELGSL